MNRQRLELYALSMMLIPLFVVACASPSPTATPIPPTPTPIPPTPTATLVDTQKYVSLKVGNQWEYHLQVSQGARIIFDPFFIKPKGMLSSSATHGSGSLKYTTLDFSIRAIEMLSDTEVKVEVSNGGSILWFPINIQETRLAATKQDNGDLSFEIHAVPAKLEDWVLGQTLARLPTSVDPKALTTVRVPAAEFSRVIHSTISHPSVLDYTHVYTQESWLAEGVGLIKSVAVDQDNSVLYTLELSSYQVN